MGNGRTADGTCYIDLIGDTTNPYGLRLLRDPGVNAISYINHQGTGTLLISSLSTGSIKMKIDGNTRFVVNNDGNVGLGGGTLTEKLHVQGGVVVADHVASTPVAGTIEWDGTNFRGYDGSAWRILDN